MALGLIAAPVANPAGYTLSSWLFPLGLAMLLLAGIWGLNSWIRNQMSILRTRLRAVEGECKEQLKSMEEKRALELEALREEGALKISNLRQQIATENESVSQKFVEYRDFAHEQRRQLETVRTKAGDELSTALHETNQRLSEHLKKFLLIGAGRSNLHDLLNEEEARVGALAIQDEYPLVSYPVLRDFGLLNEIPRSSQRRLSSSLRVLGYWGASLSLLEGVVGLAASDRDLRALEMRRREYELFSGKFMPSISLGPVKYRPMEGHILHVVGKSLPKTQSGYTIRTHYTAIAQQQAGFHVSVVCQIGESETPLEERVDYVDDIAYYSLPGSDRLSRPFTEWLNDSVRELDQLVARIRPALLHAHADFLNALIAERVAKKYGIPVVYEARGFWEESWLSRTSQRFAITDWNPVAKLNGMPDAYAMRRSMEERARSGADHVFTLAKVMKVHIVEAGLKPEKVTIVPNAVDAEDFPVVGRPDALARKHNIADGDLVIGYISSIVEYEGIDILIEAFSEVQKSTNRKIHLLLVGDGPVLGALKAQRDRDDISDVVFTGRVPHEDILSYYGLIDIFCVPRRPTDVCRLVTPLKPFEAFSSGRAVVLSDVEALQEIADDSGAALLFRAGDAHSLAKSISRLIDDGDLRVELAKRGAEWARAERTWSNNAKIYADVYSSLGVSPFDARLLVTDISSEIDFRALSDWTGEHVPPDYTRWFYSQTKFIAKDIQQSGWTYADFPPVALNHPIDWDEICHANRTWAFNLHTWEFMDPVIRAYGESGEAHYLDWVLERAVSWIDYYVIEDRHGEGSMAWYDMGLGLRSPRLTALIALALRADVAEEVLRKLIAGAMRHQFEHSLDRSFNSRTNHGYYAAIGQTVLGRGLRPLPGMLALAEQGMKRIRFMANSQFMDDGVHSEHSPDYHRMLLDSFKLGSEQGLVEDASVLKRIEKAGEALGWMIQPNGKLLQFGDGPARDMILNSPNYSTSETTNFLVNRGRAGRPNDQSMGIFPSGGLAVVRSPQPVSTDDHEDSSYLALSAAFHSRAHKHADDLNVVWYDRGHEILVDAGRFGYGKLLAADSPLRADGFYYDSPERQYVESTIAHNTVAADGLNHERRRSKPYGSGLETCTEADGTYLLSGSVEHLQWEHGRKVSMLPGKWLVIDDAVKSLDGQHHDFRSWLNLSGDFDAEVVDDSMVRFTHADWEEPLWIEPLSGAQLILPVRGETEPLRGWRSVKDRELIETWSVGFGVYQQQKDLISTVLSFGPEPLYRDPRAH